MDRQLSTQLIPPSFFPASMSRTEKNRLNKYALYIGTNWTTHNLTAYRDYLLQSGLSQSSVKAHLSTVRAGLERISLERDYWYSVAPSADVLERKAFVDELVTRLQNAINPKVATVNTTVVQDRLDTEFVRLTVKQQTALLKQPNRASLAGLRDAAIIGLALATGLRADELCSLTVADLRQTVGGEMGVYVREGKGNKARFVPYGAERGVLALIDVWSERAGVTEGDVFRGVNNKGQILASGIDPRSFERRLARYSVDGLTVTPHDLRRTYAKTRYQQGMDILAIRDNLGHADIRTTQIYIGDVDISERVPTAGLDYQTA